MGIQKVSARRVRRELINHNLYLFAWPLRVDYGWPFVNDAKFKKYIFSHSTKYICTQGIFLHPATVYLCCFNELYFVKLEGNYILANCQGNKFIQKTYSFTKSKIIRGNYIRSGNYIHFKDISSFKENIFIQGKLYPFKEIYSFKEHIFVQVQGHMFIQGNYIHSTTLYVRGHSRNIYSKIVLSHFMIIISFTVTISWIRFSYNSFRLKDEEIADMIESSVLFIITVRVAFATIVRRNTTRIAARVRHYIFAKIWYARQRAVYI